MPAGSLPSDSCCNQAISLSENLADPDRGQSAVAIFHHPKCWCNLRPRVEGRRLLRLVLLRASRFPAYEPLGWATPYRE